MSKEGEKINSKQTHDTVSTEQKQRKVGESKKVKRVRFSNKVDVWFYTTIIVERRKMSTKGTEKQT